MLNLLLIDDNKGDRYLVLHELRREFADLNVEEVVDEKDFQKALKKGRFNVVITDYRLQWTDGLMILHTIKSQYPNCPVIMFTDSGNQDIAVEAMKSGLDDYLTKSSKHYARLPLAVKAVLQRVSDRITWQQTELALHKSEERFSKAFQLAPIAISITTLAEGRFIEVNKSCEELFGYSRSEMIGRTSVELELIADVNTRDRIVEQLLQHGELRNFEYILRTRTGQLCNLLVSIEHIEVNGLPCLLSMFFDITERKQAEVAIQQLNVTLEQQVEERTQQLQRSLTLEVLLKRVTDKVRDSLDEHHILQAAVQELADGLEINGCDIALYNLETQTATITHEYIRSELPPAQHQVIELTAYSELYKQLLNGEYVHFCPISARFNPARPTQQQFTILACPIIEDQTVLGDLWLFQLSEDYFDDQEIRLVQQVASQCAIALRQARLYDASQSQVKALERLNHLKDDFLNTVSHELRTPMSSIKVAAHLLESILFKSGQPNNQRELIPSNHRAPAKSYSLDPSDFQKAARYFQILQAECQREINLINDLLDLSRLESTPDPLTLTMLELQVWIPHIIQPFMAHAHRQNQTIKVELPSQLPAFTTDVPKLERVLIELLNNACKYTPPNETIRVTATATSDTIQIQISNSGIEIAATEHDRIFDKFYRIPNSDPWRHGGTGLGLALVKKLVEHLGGSIDVTTQCGWTIFSIELPLKAQQVMVVT